MVVLNHSAVLIHLQAGAWSNPNLDGPTFDVAVRCILVGVPLKGGSHTNLSSKARKLSVCVLLGLPRQVGLLDCLRTPLIRLVFVLFLPEQNA